MFRQERAGGCLQNDERCLAAVDIAAEETRSLKLRQSDQFIVVRAGF